MTTSVYLVLGLLLVGISQISALSEDEIREMAMALHNACVEETGVELELVLNCLEGDFAEDQKLKCYMRCLFVAVTVMDEETGEVDLATAEGMIPDEFKSLAVPILHECGVVKGVDDCDTAFQTVKCWKSKAPPGLQLM